MNDWNGTVPWYYNKKLDICLAHLYVESAYEIAFYSDSKKTAVPEIVGSTSTIRAGKVQVWAVVEG